MSKNLKFWEFKKVQSANKYKNCIFESNLFVKHCFAINFYFLAIKPCILINIPLTPTHTRSQMNP